MGNEILTGTCSPATCELSWRTSIRSERPRRRPRSIDPLFRRKRWCDLRLESESRLEVANSLRESFRFPRRSDFRDELQHPNLYHFPRADTGPYSLGQRYCPCAEQYCFSISFF